MKGSELRPCDGCGGSLLVPHMTQFYVVNSSAAMIDQRAMQQTGGLAMMFGGATALAEMFSPNPEIVMVLGEKDPALMTEMLICFNCYTQKPLAEIQEALNARSKDEIAW